MRRALTRWTVALAAILSAVALLSAASAADAKIRTTRYYTINVAPPTPSSSGLFLGTNGRPVVLQRYFSGDVGQHWTQVYPEWPFSAPVTATSPLDGILDCRPFP